MKKKKSIPVFILMMIFILSQPIFAQESETKQKLPIELLPAGVSIYQLDNGLHVLLIENPALPMVGVNVVVKVGSAYENFKTSGMSHCLEHLLFNGTTTRTQKQLYDETDMIGGYNNANTSEYFTNYMMVMPAEHMRKGMELQADMLFNSVIPEEKFVKEKGIVLEEISKSLNDVTAQLDRNIISILFAGHAMSLPTLGTYATIEHMDRDEVYAFYKNNYVPNNMILSAIGNFESTEMLTMIDEIYGKVKPGEVIRETSDEWGTAFQPPKSNMVGQDQVFFRYYDGGTLKHQLFYRLPQIENPAFFNLLNARLEEHAAEIENTVKSEAGDAVKSVSITTRQTPLASFIEVQTSLSEKADFRLIEKTISAQLRRIDFSLSPENVEVEIAKARTNFLKNIEKPHMFGIYNAHEFAVKGIEAVLAAYDGSNILQAADRLKHIRIYPNPLVIIQSPAESVSDRDAAASLETQLFSKPESGKNLIVVQNPASNLLAIHYLMKHKAMYESRYGKNAAKILHDCVGQRLQSEENEKVSSKFGLTYKVNDLAFLPMDDIYLHPDFGYIRAEGLADDIEGVITFLNKQLKNFVPTQEEFEKASQKFSGGMSMMMMGMGDKAKKLFEKTYKAYIYEKAAYPENEETVTYETLVSFSKEYFQPGNMIISVVSPETLDHMDQLFSEFSGKAIEDEPAAENKKLILNEEEITFDQPGGGKRSFLFWGFIKKVDPKDKSALKALSLILSDQIVFDIREKRGMAYHMSAGIDMYGDKAMFYIRQGTRPENVDILLPIYPDFFKIKNLKSVTEKDLEKSINMYLGRMMFRRLSSINRAYYLAHSLYFHNDINYDQEFHAQLKKITLEDVKRVAKKYMKIENPISVVVR